MSIADEGRTYSPMLRPPPPGSDIPNMRGVARVLLVAAAVMAASAQSYPPVPVITIPGKLNFAVLGDWGRTGGEKSVTPASEGGYDTTGYCTKNFKADVDEDIEGALGQATTALVMDKAIKLHDNTPAALTAQLQYIEWALSTSTADWTIVVGHHPVVGGAATVYGFNASRVPATNFDLGTRTATGAGRKDYTLTVRK
ncbi:purple acid phosphatase 17 [Haematococcus lacustris]|uniref:Purple acid phosphatase 17 n=1 Tax=Haematococcus lacustris TaxID=44745 RepID=A0A699YN04_HAELA|nr:purple acid phosphatase 17 [Haematococcus lacustris]